MSRRFLLLFFATLTLTIFYTHFTVSGQDHHYQQQHYEHDAHDHGDVVGSFTPHDGMQAPGSVIHHIDALQSVNGYHHHQEEEQRHSRADTQYHQEDQQYAHVEVSSHLPSSSPSYHPSNDHLPSDTQHDTQHDAGHDTSIHPTTPGQPSSDGHYQTPHWTPEVHENIQVAKAPEHNVLYMSCPVNEGFIHVLDSSFGQGQGGFDFSTGVIAKGYCHTALDINNAACLGKQNCLIHVNSHSANGIDPCPGVAKRAVVTFKCSHAPIPDHIQPTHESQSPTIELHDFLPPPSVAAGGLDHPTQPPSAETFWQHFFHAQQNSPLTFPNADGGIVHGDACEQDAHRFCGGEIKNCVGDFHCAHQCLTDHAPNLSPDCLNQHPCYPDIHALCRDVHGGENQIMECLKKNSAHLSALCTRLHPCLLDASCHAIDYDDPHIQPHAPIFKNLPTYMNMLHTARQAEEGSPDKVAAFHHLVLPTVVRDGNHPALLEQQKQHHDADQQQHHDQHQLSESHDPSSGHSTEVHDDNVDHHDSSSTDVSQPTPEHADLTEGTDEDVPNESDPSFDAATLGTGHFSHIFLQSHPEHAIDVHTKGIPPSDGFEVSLWSVRRSRNQMFDLNHFGQIFWIHEGDDHRHYCLTAHPTQQHQIVSQLCIHASHDGGVTLAEEGHPQVWNYHGTQIHHLQTGKCLEAQAIQHGVGNGNSLFLVDCATHETGQQWSWESGSLAEHNEHIFDEHHAAVMQHRAQQAHQQQQHSEQVPHHEEHPSPSTDHTANPSDHVTYIHDQTDAAHESAQLAQSDHAAMEQLHAQSEAISHHESLLQHEQQQLSHDESVIHQLEERVNEIAAKEAEDHQAIELEHQQIEAERQQLQHEEDEVRQHEARLKHLEEEYQHQHHGGEEHHDENQPPHEESEQHHEYNEHHTGEDEIHSDAYHGEGHLADSTTDNSSHFFTPVTLILSILFISVLAYVFRVYLFPFFVKRWYNKAQRPSHYYSHAY